MRGFTEDEKDECCGTCEWHKYVRRFNAGWLCDNVGSMYYHENTDYSDSCEQWEDRKS